MKKLTLHGFNLLNLLLRNNSFIYRIASIIGQVTIWLIEKLLSAFIRQSSPVHDTANYAFTKMLEQNAPLILEELRQLLQSNVPIPHLNELSAEQKRIVQGRGWKTFILLLYGKEATENISLTPNTYRIVCDIPGVTTAFFSVMEGKTHITPHRGPYRGVLRCHLPLMLPLQNDLAWIAINGVKYNWRQNKCMIFDDTFVHEAKNESEELRIVLFIDFKREFPFPINILNSLMIYVISISPFIQNTMKKVEQKASKQA